MGKGACGLTRTIAGVFAACSGPPTRFRRGGGMFYRPETSPGIAIGLRDGVSLQARHERRLWLQPW